MKELRDIYRSPNFKSGAYQVQPRYAILASAVISGLVFEAGCFHYVLLCLESGWSRYVDNTNVYVLFLTAHVSWGTRSCLVAECGYRSNVH
jgi:hypothetical protein